MTTIIRGNALALPLPDSNVDLIVTSPPYFGLRSYQDGGEHYAGQIGSEATPAEFVDALLAATREMVRVLKPSGSIWVNLGDKYATAAPTGTSIASGRATGRTPEQLAVLKSMRPNIDSTQFAPRKSLIGIPWRYALRCIDTTQGVPVHIVREMVAAVYNGNLDPRACDEILKEYENGGRNAGLGLILRAEIIWSKPNGLPESVTDRVRRSHETWFHFVTQPRYFSAVDEIREAYEPGSADRRLKYGANPKGAGRGVAPESRGGRQDGVMGFGGPDNVNPLGKLPGSVWTIPTQPLKVPPHLGVDHFAAFPMEWPRRIIQGWSPAGICTGCGEGRRPVSTKTASHREGGYRPENDPLIRRAGRSIADVSGSTLGMVSEFTITGYACACPKPIAPTHPAVVLDPFGGTGTTALVAKALGRHGISIDLSQDYCRLAQWRTTDPGELARALQVEAPEPVPDGQLSLFGDAS